MFLLQLDKRIEQIIAEATGASKAPKPLLAHCRRELFHEAWKILLKDEEFIRAYRYGFVVTCADGITRRIFPRIFSYSADYPEK